MKRRSFIRTAAAGATAFCLARLDQQVSEQIQQMGDKLNSATNANEFWQTVRGCFELSPDIIHLNCGSIGACPSVVTNALIQYTKAIEKDPFRNLFGDGLVEKLETVRSTAARFINAMPDELAVTRNTTEGMNLIARGLELNPDDEVLTTNHEHPGGMVCWQHLARRRGVKVVCIKLPNPVSDPTEILKLIRENITARTKVFSFCHVDTITGYRMPVFEISQLARRQEAFFVCDGAQVPGMLSVDVKRLGVDAYASSSHKWMLAPKGSGLLYIATKNKEQVKSLELSAGYQVYSASSGTRDVAKILAHGIAIEFQNMIGKDKIENRVCELSRYLGDRLMQINALRRLSATSQESSSGIVTFALDPEIGTSDNLARRLMNQHKIYVKAVQETFQFVSEPSAGHENYNAMRFSTHIFNNEQEVDVAVKAIAKLLNQAPNR